MFQLPKKPNELKDTMISARVRKSVAQKLKKMAKDNNLSVADVLEHLVEAAFENLQKTEDKKKK